MRPSEVRANYVFYIGAAPWPRPIIALIRALPTIALAFRQGFQDLRGSIGEAGSRLRTDNDLPIWVTVGGSRYSRSSSRSCRRSASTCSARRLIVVFGFFFVRSAPASPARSA